MKSRSITKTFFFYTSFSTILILGSLASHMIFSGIRKEKDNIAFKKEQYIENKKNLIKNQIDLTVQFVNYEKNLFEKTNNNSIPTIKDSILKQIAKIRFDNNGYIFVVSFDGTTLMNDMQKDMIGQNQWEITDPDGVKIVQEERKAAENPDGGFIFYSWYKPGSEEPTPKISFVKAIHEWEWMIGTGIYLEDIDNIIAKEHEHFKKETARYIISILIVFSSIIILLIFIVRYIANKTNESFNIFSDFFKKAAAQSTKIDIQNLFFSEFIDPAISANEMIIKLEEARNKLLDFNQELEQRVKERTNEILLQKEEILTQNEEINAQKEELEHHRNNLEHIVEERTKDLEIAKIKAEESDRLKTSFLANMSHEIRTPMNAIIGFSNLLEDNKIDPKTKTKYIKEITKSSYTLLRLIENILDIAKIETQQLIINYKQFNLIELLNEVHSSFSKTINTDLLQLKFNSNNQENLLIYSDRFRIKQIINNLVENAIKFSEKGIIEIGYSVDNKLITIYVKDTGIGMNEKQLSNIFTRFTKIEDEKQKLYRGAGLGLSICNHLIQMLDGKIWVESEKEKGSIFYFTIPYSKLAKEKN